jgi:hypothetical protein
MVAPVYKPKINAALNMEHPLLAKVGTTSPAAAVEYSVQFAC